MKELTIEQKAQRYDEAIKRIQSYVVDEHGCTRIKVVNVFPELAESEDEKIRKELIEFVKSRGGFKQEYIAWLEKQQKPFDYENANIQQMDFAPNGDKPRYNIGDVLCDKSCTTLDKDAQPNFEIVDIRNGMYICDKGSFPISQQDEYELVAKKIEQKPIDKVDQHSFPVSDDSSLPTFDEGIYHPCTENAHDWSDEDEKQLQHAMLALQWYAGGTDIIDWLKSLKDRVQPKQEWSEEDENMLKLILTDYRTRGAKEDSDIITWLKSLRPRSQWKPSEEQMKYLAKAIAPDQFKDELTAKEKMLVSFTTEELETELKRRSEL